MERGIGGSVGAQRSDVGCGEVETPRQTGNHASLSNDAIDRPLSEPGGLRWGDFALQVRFFMLAHGLRKS